MVEYVAELLPLRPQVADVPRVRRRLKGDALGDLQSIALEAGALRRVVRQEPHRRDAEVDEDLRADPVVARVRREAELDVRLDGVAALLLELVREELVRQSDRPPLVPAHVQEDAATLSRDPFHRGFELLAAVASKRRE